MDCKRITRRLTKRLMCPLCCGNKECEYANSYCTALSGSLSNNDPAHRCAESYVYRYMSHDG